MTPVQGDMQGHTVKGSRNMGSVLGKIFGIFMFFSNYIIDLMRLVNE